MTAGKLTGITISLATHDLRRAFDFYRKGFGLSLAADVPEGEMPEPVEFALDEKTTLMVVPTGGFKFVLGKRSVVASPDMSECILGLSFATKADLDAQVERARAAGATVESKASDLPWGYSTNLRDPDGHVWMLVVPKR